MSDIPSTLGQLPRIPKRRSSQNPIPRTSVNKGENTLSALTIHREFIATDYSGPSEL